MFICSKCKKPLRIVGNRLFAWEFCQCSTSVTSYASNGTSTVTGFGEITNNQSLTCPGYEALAARTEVPKAFYDAFDEDKE